MTHKLFHPVRTAQIAAWSAVIIAAAFAGIEWLTAVCAVALGWVIVAALGRVMVTALLREQRTEESPPLRRFTSTVAVPIVIGLTMMTLLLFGLPAYLLPFGYLIWWFMRPSEG